MDKQPQAAPGVVRELEYASVEKPVGRRWPQIVLLVLTGFGVGLLLSMAFGYQRPEYTFLYPFQILGLLALTMILVGLFWRVQRSKFLFGVMIVTLGLPFAAIYALKRWPGGDDGGGMGWMLLAIPGSCLLALFTLVIGAIVLALGQTGDTKVKIVVSTICLGLMALLLALVLSR
ncbi:MAG: hypothetical protein WCJ97_10420 [Phycisphaerae bacterium]